MSINGFFSLIMATIAVGFFVSRVLTGFLPHFFRVPPAKWRQRVNNAMMRAEKNPNKVPAMDFGWKNGSVRRNLILASYQPSAYTNKNQEKRIKIGPQDRAKRESFVNRLAVNLRPYERKIFGFFHPYCNAGGGGEKVLWKAVETTLQNDRDCVVAIYTGDNDVSGEEILANVTKRFEYTLDNSRIVFVFLTKRHLVDPQTWPKLTLLGQAFGSVVLAVEALWKLTPDVWCETMGYPFTYPFVRWFVNIPIVTYTHYPVISSDMLQKLTLMPDFKRSIRLQMKYFYWRFFMLLYSFAGRYVDIATTNSTWTQNHISNIWPQCSRRIIYPPCSTEKLTSDQQEKSWDRENQAVIIAQFRPEKRHTLIIHSFAMALKKIPQSQKVNLPKLVFIGSTRSSIDQNYVEELKKLAYETLEIPQKYVEFKTDCEYEVMKGYLQRSSFGINAMWNEHFGIAVVEYAAAGLIPLVHASAGPLLDIVVPWDTTTKTQAIQEDETNNTGFFFRDVSDPDYTSFEGKKYPTLDDLFTRVSELSSKQKLEISTRAKECVLNKFSDEKFAQEWTKVLEDIPTIDLNL